MKHIYFDDYRARSQRVYLMQGLSYRNVSYLKHKGFKEVKKTNLHGKKKIYLVNRYEKESERHMITIFEAVRFLRKISTKIETYRSVRPDIVFKFNKKWWAIEVETGIAHKNRKKLLQKAEALDEEFEDRWCFLLTDRNFKTRYEKYGKTFDKRNFRNGIIKFLMKDKL